MATIGSRRHKWAWARLRSRWMQHHFGRPPANFIRRCYCIKCGAAHWTDPFRYDKPPPSGWFRPWGGVARKIKHMPPCEGLPPGYDPPLG